MQEKTEKKYFQIDNKIEWFGVLGATRSYNFYVDWVFEDTIEISIRNIFGVNAFKVEVKERFVVDVYSGWKLIAKGAIVGDILKFPSPIV